MDKPIVLSRHSRICYEPVFWTSRSHGRSNLHWL